MGAAYTEKQAEELKKEYLKNPTREGVMDCARKFHRTPRSIVAKLTKMGVYVKNGYLDKLGRRPVTKLALVSQVEQLLGTELPDLDKAPKETLRTLRNGIQKVRQGHIEESQRISKQLGMSARDILEEFEEMESVKDL